MKIVVVDDVERYTKVMAEVLTARGHDVYSIVIEWHTKTSPKQLADDILAKRPDRVLLDHDFKRDWTGKDVAKHLSSLTKRLISTSSHERARTYLARYVDKDELSSEWLSKLRGWPHHFEQCALRFCKDVEKQRARMRSRT